ncbi:porin [Oxalobacteraceae bacterium]|nr:porin [Oxalobacteraceae bacterium]
MTIIISPKLLTRRTALAAGISIACVSGLAHAEDDQRFSLHGFGTIGLVHSDNAQADFVSNLQQPSGPGRSRATDFTTDTKAGVQLNAKLLDQWTAVLQVTSKKLHSNNFSPKVEWANVKYEATPDFSVRVGRIALASLMQSDARLVGYASTPIRVPLETYNIIPPTNSDGVDATYQMHFGTTTNTIQASYGRNDSHVAIGIPDNVLILESKARKILNVSDAVEIGALTLRASYFRTDLNISGTVYRYDMKALGAVYDPGAWFVQSEYTRSNGGGLTKNQAAWYAMGGLRLKAFTPYLGYATAKPQDPLLPAAGYQQTTTTAGIRWDFRSNASLKLQYDQIKMPGAIPSGGSAGYFVKQDIGAYLNGGKTKLLSLAVDFVF